MSDPDRFLGPAEHKYPTLEGGKYRFVEPFTASTGQSGSQTGVVGLHEGMFLTPLAGVSGVGWV